MMANINRLPLIKGESRAIKVKITRGNASGKQNSFYNSLDRDKIEDSSVNFAKNIDTVGSVKPDMNDKLILEKKIRYILDDTPHYKVETVEKPARDNLGVRKKRKNLGNVVEKYFSKIRTRKTVSNKVDGDGYRVQIVALKNKQQTIDYVNLFKKTYSDLLKNLSIFIDELNLEEKGIFYRVQVGVFSTRAEANSFCEIYLKRSGGDVTNCVLMGR
ncbi:MAG: SPOR domain-containing protein [Rickettsiales bacterium]|jgi:hypothetical protein|nr:SPOR domain-containing protein [Rickettsiales bacterium]